MIITVSHKILITKLNNYGVRNKNMKWFITHSSNGKQYISRFDSTFSRDKLVRKAFPWECKKKIGVILNENLTWRKHINIIENKISKNISLQYKAKFLLFLKYLKSIYFSFIHSYIKQSS